MIKNIISKSQNTMASNLRILRDLRIYFSELSSNGYTSLHELNLISTKYPSFQKKFNELNFDPNLHPGGNFTLFKVNSLCGSIKEALTNETGYFYKDIVNLHHDLLYSKY
jgi:hypothetical protein